jgi:hypothetical protein
MNSPRPLIITCFLFLLLASSTLAQTNKITAAEAKDHVAETRTVCGKVASTHYATGSKGQPTFLNLDEPYPKEVFTLLPGITKPQRPAQFSIAHDPDPASENTWRLPAGRFSSSDAQISGG